MRVMVIPDTQVKPGVPTEHLEWAAQYAVDKKPDVIVHLGDHYDMPSLSSYDVGKKSFEGRRYVADIEAGNAAIQKFDKIVDKEILKREKGHRVRWRPRRVFTLGNHEQRIERAVENDPKVEGIISYNDLALHCWEVYPFLEVVVIEGVAFSHYFTSGIMGRPISSARMLLTKKMMSCVQGHVQDRDIAYGRRADGKNITGLFAGIFYQHEESYLTPQTNQSWRGLWMLNEVADGSFDELPVSMNYLRSKYE